MHANRRCVTVPLFWRLAWSGFAAASVSAFKVTRRGTHYKFLLVWTLWYVGHVVAFISVDTLCGFNVPCCHNFSEMRDFCFLICSWGMYNTGNTNLVFSCPLDSISKDQELIFKRRGNNLKHLSKVREAKITSEWMNEWMYMSSFIFRNF